MKRDKEGHCIMIKGSIQEEVSFQEHLCQKLLAKREYIL